jgi:hypothetical protein
MRLTDRGRVVLVLAWCVGLILMAAWLDPSLLTP